MAPRAWADIDLAAIRHNVRTLRAAAAPARMCAVVKANGYGHGAAAVGTGRARGRRRLAGRRPGRRGRRAARRRASTRRCWCCPSPALDEVDAAIAMGARLTVYTSACVGGHRQVGAGPAGAAPVPVHLKVDTGMHRVGCAPGRRRAAGQGRSPTSPRSSSRASAPTARWPTSPTTRSPTQQIARFDAVLAELRAAGIDPRHRPRRQLGRPRSSCPTAALRPGALRHRRLRHPAGPRAGGRRRPASRR